MQYRQFGKLDWKVSALGFGAMRLPTTGQGMSAPVDEPEAIKMIRYGIDHGINYLDTAYPYHNGNSEKVVGKALQDGYREKIRLATKMPINMLQKAGEFDRIFNEQLERLQTNKINYYLMHGLNKTGLQNYVDVNIQAGRRGVEHAASKGLAIVVMEPLRGGMIAKTPPEQVAKIWDSAPKKRSLAERGLLWVWNQPEISLALSGMSTMEQLTENLAIADRSGPGKLSAQELALYDRVRETYKSLSPVPCTKCRYCQPCPNGVDIPGIFDLYNEVSVYNAPQLARMRYQSPRGMKPENRADKCLDCGECVEKCPQNIDIPGWLKKADEKLSAPK